MIEKIKALCVKYKEVLLYLIFGVLTTAVNYIIFTVCVLWFPVDVYVSNIIAWIGAVLFAYFTNRSIVFASAAKGAKELFREIVAFYGARFFSLLVETALMFVFIDLLHINEFITKLILQVVVIVLNYIFSKFLIFRKKKTVTEPAADDEQSSSAEMPSEEE